MADPREVTGWLVVIRAKEENVVLRPSPGVEWYATIHSIASVYHRMTANPERHTLSVIPKCMIDIVDLDMVPRGVVVLEEAKAIALGATRCPNCTWGA